MPLLSATRPEKVTGAALVVRVLADLGLSTVRVGGVTSAAEAPRAKTPRITSAKKLLVSNNALLFPITCWMLP